MEAPARRPGVIPPRNEPMITQRLAAWWVLAAGVVASLAFVATDHIWRATATMSATLLVCAGLRVVLPFERAGGLIVRRAALDVLALVALAVAMAVVGFNLDLTSLK